MVLLAVRPFDAIGAVRDLPWRADQTVVSLCAGVGLGELAPHVAPARTVRAMPVIAARFGYSPTCIFPGDAAVEALFGRCGSAIALDREDQFDVATAMACHSSALTLLIGAMAQWNAQAGLDADTARILAAQSMRAAAETVLGRPDVSVPALVDELAIPASATRAGVEVLRGLDACSAWTQANEAVIAHVRGRQQRPQR